MEGNAERLKRELQIKAARHIDDFVLEDDADGFIRDILMLKKLDAQAIDSKVLELANELNMDGYNPDTAEQLIDAINQYLI